MRVVISRWSHEREILAPPNNNNNFMKENKGILLSEIRKSLENSRNQEIREEIGISREIGSSAYCMDV